MKSGEVTDYAHNYDPFEHQKNHVEEHSKKAAWGLLWEQGTAKTKPTIDSMAMAYYRGEIDAMLVVAPPGVERNWRSDEIPTHLPSDIALDTMSEVYKTEKKHTQNHKKLMERLLHHDGLSILMISYAAFMTKEGKNFIWRFLQRRSVFYVLDESHNIKSPNAKRTKSVVASGKYGKFRRVLTGTPYSVGPFDIYSQVKFLDEFFWKNKGIHGAMEFRQEFGEWLTREQHQQLFGYDPGYHQLKGYRNIDKLKRWLSEISDRYEKDDVLDLPPKLFSKRYFEPTKEMRNAYQTLGEELMLEIGDELITAELPIVKLLRLQQIACNYVPMGDKEPVHKFTDKNPRLNPVEELRDEMNSPCIIWARFHHDIDQLMDLLGPKAVQYDGRVPDDEAERNKRAFQNGDAEYFVGTQAKGGPGLTLTAAKNVIYYNNSFKYIDRLQSEDRPHRPGMDEHPVNYYDIVSDLPVDWRVVENLRSKNDIINDLNNSEWKEWI